MTTTKTPDTASPTRRQWVSLALLATAQLMLVLDVTVVNVALPQIGLDLGLDRAALPWVLTIYTLAFGGLMLLGGRVSDIVGSRRMVLVGLAVFTASSLMCGLAQGATSLLVGRAAQGVGAALLSPAALGLVMKVFRGPQRARAIGVWAALSGVGSALGVVLGGVLTSEAGWRWVFAINVPIGLALLVAVPIVVPADLPESTAGRALDLPGALLVTCGTSAAIYGLINAGSHGWTSVATVTTLVLAGTLWAGFAVVERASRHPLLRLELLRHRGVSSGALLMVSATGLLVGGFFLGSFALQYLHGLSAVEVGMAFLPVAAATVAGAHTASNALTRISARRVGAVGLTLAAIGYGLMTQTAHAWTLVVGLAVAALGIGATFVTAFTSSLAGARAGEAGLRSAIVNTFHELGGAFGVAALSTAAGSGLVAGQLDPAGFHRAFVVGCVAALASVLATVVLVPSVTRSAESGPHGH
jgi:EmrB/QacA subfamily drug resistance transporter